jgi:hypothetical protein
MIFRPFLSVIGLKNFYKLQCKCMEPRPKSFRIKSLFSAHNIRPTHESTTKPSKKKKMPIRKALREQVWIQKAGKVFETKCSTPWCENPMNVFDFHCGHNIPESQGGPTNVENLIPLCSRCNLSMGDSYTIQEWFALQKRPLSTAIPPSPDPSITSCCLPFWKLQK